MLLSGTTAGVLLKEHLLPAIFIFTIVFILSVILSIKIFRQMHTSNIARGKGGEQ